ncbi:MAG TPA: hypothetical protein PK993_02710 [Clostridia bacterium]|nr:hypothetical protein [Clostridia bacterium]
MKKRRSNMRFLLVGVYIVLTILGIVLIKRGGNAGAISIKEGNLLFGISYISLIGFICYVLSFLIYTRVITMFDLSYITPIVTGIVQISILIASFFIFKEQINKYGIIGASLIIIGVIVMNINSLKK